MPREFESGFLLDRTITDLHVILGNSTHFELEYGWPSSDTVPDVNGSASANGFVGSTRPNQAIGQFTSSTKQLYHDSFRVPSAMATNFTKAATFSSPNNQTSTADLSSVSEVVRAFQATLTPEQLEAAAMLNDMSLGFSNFPTDLQLPPVTVGHRRGVS